MADEGRKRDIIGKSLERSLEEFSKLENSYKTISNSQQQLAARQEEYADRQRLINDLMSNFDMLSDDGVKKLDELVKKQDEETVGLRKATKELETQNKRLAEQRTLYNNIADSSKRLWGYLNQNDKIIRQTILNLGMSGVKAELMRNSFEQSALYAAKLGGGLEDVQSIITGFADETGRARVLSDEMVKSVLAMGRGTGLGVEQATKLAAQFEYMGIDAKNAMEFVQGVVDTSERMGVNTTKVLKTVTDNFKKLSTFTFQNGVKAFGQMAADAERTRVNMSTALNVADATRSLDKVIELGANLQIMGGRFAEMDPFQWLYMVRNEPDKLNEKISEMTKGIYTFKKNSEGVMEKFISPADRDRLSQIANSLGIAQEEMFQIAQRRLDLDTISKQLQGMGLSAAQKELIEGAAQMDSKSGKYQVMLGGTMRDISSLTLDQAKAFEQEQKLLEDRAKQAQTFDEAFKATINELKSVLLPMLQGVKKVLDAVRPIAEGFTKFVDWAGKSAIGEWLLKGGGLVMAGGFLLIKAFSMFSGLVGNLRSIIPAVGKGFGKIPTTGTAAPIAPAAGGKAGGAAKALGTGAGVGLAAVGIGEGINLAAQGISKLADSMSKLTPEQAKSLSTIATTMAITFPLAAIGVAALGAAAQAGALGLLALGAAFVGIGFGINLATKGIGKMSEGLGTMFTAVKGSGPDMTMAAAGIAGIATALAASTFAIPAAITMAMTIGSIAKHANNLQKASDSLEKIKLSLSGDAEDFKAIAEAISSIGKVNVRGGGAIADLASILKKPLKVEFADKRLTVVSDITLNIDGERMTQKVIRVPAFIERVERIRSGKEGTA